MHCCISIMYIEYKALGLTDDKMGRKFFVGGNWKMNGTKAEIDTICSWLTAGPLDPNCEVTWNRNRKSTSIQNPGFLTVSLKVVVGVPGCYLQYVADKLPKNIGVAAQNCYKAAKGAFTGELAPAMVQVIQSLRLKHFFAMERVFNFAGLWCWLGDPGSFREEECFRRDWWTDWREGWLIQTKNMFWLETFWKVGFALQSGLNVLPCIGEKLEEREGGITNEVKLKVYV